MLKTIQKAGVILLLLSSCGSTEELPQETIVTKETSETTEEAVPFQFIAPFAQKIYTGEQDDVNHLILHFPFKDSSKVKLDSVYYFGNAGPIELVKSNQKMEYRAIFNLPKVPKDAIVAPY